MVESMIYYTFVWQFQKFSLFLRKSLLCQTMELMDIMKQRRETLSLTQQDLAEMSQVGLATIKDIERGKGNPALIPADILYFHMTKMHYFPAYKHHIAI